MEKGQFDLKVNMRVALLFLLHCVSAANAVEITVDCAKPLGVIRPLHGGNSGPLNYGDLVDLTADHKELCIPHTRLHDCHWPNPDVVDIHCIFPDFKADPQSPDSYDFSKTDRYIQATVNTGAQIVFRLGESIEHTEKKYFVHPPKDYAKWVDICINIIRHYNEGWANGFRHNIKYWEIWNEPENRPAMWTGSDEDYFRLYGMASKAIKARFPELKIGGPSIGHSGKMKNGKLEPTPFLKSFLEYCGRESAPLDFFSWHIYTDRPRDPAEKARGIRALLDEYGFTKAESHLNEWNFLPRNDWGPMLLQGQGEQREKLYAEIGGLPGAAFTAATLIHMQDAPIDVANYYTAEIQGFGLFTFHGARKKTFYAMKAFKILLDTPNRVNAECNDAAVAVCAGANEKKSAVGVLASNFSNEKTILKLNIRNLPWSSKTRAEALILDSDQNLKAVPINAGYSQINMALDAHAVVLIRLMAN